MLFKIDNIFNLHQEPSVDVGMAEHFIHCHTKPKGVRDIENALGPSFSHFAHERVFSVGSIQINDRVEAVYPDLQTAQRFLQRLLLIASNRHHLTHRLHLCCKSVVGAGELFKVETWNFGNHIINGWLKGRWR